MAYKNQDQFTADELRDRFGHWNEHPDHPHCDWVYEVQANDTRLGYWEWVAARESEE